MSKRYYRPTLVLPPAMEQTISLLADELHIEPQDFMRDAVIAAVRAKGFVNFDASVVASQSEYLLMSLTRLARKLGAAKAELDGLIAQTGRIDASTTDDLLVEADAAASEANALAEELGEGTRRARKTR